MELINIYTQLGNVGGAQKMCLFLHIGLSKYKDFYKGYVSCYNDYNDIDESYQSIIKESDYLKFNAFKLIRNYPNAIFISVLLYFS